MIAKMLIASVGTLLSLAEVCSAKEWRGINPLHSTCDDVKRILNVSRCETSYDTEEGRVYLSFARKPCADGWNVPPGTVLSITVAPKARPRLDQLGLNFALYKKEVLPHSPDYTYYSNREEGITVTVTADDVVHRIDYYPAAKDDELRCHNESGEATDARPIGSVKFDEYGDIDVKELRKRLDDFAAQLRAQPETQAYIIAYGGRQSRPGEAKDKAACAERYLIKRQRISSRRIVTMDAGFRKEAAVALYIRLENGSLPETFPGIAQKEVKIVKKPRSTCELMRSWE